VTVLIVRLQEVSIRRYQSDHTRSSTVRGIDHSSTARGIDHSSTVRGIDHSSTVRGIDPWFFCYPLDHISTVSGIDQSSTVRGIDPWFFCYPQYWLRHVRSKSALLQHVSLDHQPDAVLGNSPLCSEIANNASCALSQKIFDYGVVQKRSHSVHNLFRPTLIIKFRLPSEGKNAEKCLGERGNRRVKKINDDLNDSRNTRHQILLVRSNQEGCDGRGM
jgi:hypothetical protein